MWYRLVKWLAHIDTASRWQARTWTLDVWLQSLCPYPQPLYALQPYFAQGHKYCCALFATSHSLPKVEPFLPWKNSSVSHFKNAAHFPSYWNKCRPPKWELAKPVYPQQGSQPASAACDRDTKASRGVEKLHGGKREDIACALVGGSWQGEAVDGLTRSGAFCAIA